MQLINALQFDVVILNENKKSKICFALFITFTDAFLTKIIVGETFF